VLPHRPSLATAPARYILVLSPIDLERIPCVLFFLCLHVSSSIFQARILQESDGGSMFARNKCERDGLVRHRSRLRESRVGWHRELFFPFLSAVENVGFRGCK
jgi:hypothetical protein